MTPLESTFPDRLVPLLDGRPGLRTAMQVEVREPSPAAGSDTQLSTLNSQPVLDFVASDATLDRYGEIISPAGWHLDNYRRNPVFQNAHQHGDIIHTLGRALITELRSTPREAPDSLSTLNSQPSTYLFQRIQFATDANPIARIAYALYKGHFLNAVSVGFIPLRWEDGDGGRGAGERGAGERGMAAGRRYLEQELLEVSAVAIPANPNALTLALKSGALDKSDLRETADLLRALISGSADCQSAVSPTGSRRGAGGEQPPADCQSAIQPTDSRRYGSAASQPSPPGAGSQTFSSVSTLNPQLLHFARTLRDILSRS